MGLDTVEIIMGLEEAFGIQIQDDEAERVRTVWDVTNLICQKVGATDGPAGYCPSARAFRRLRGAMVTVGGIPRTSIQLDTCIRPLLPEREGKERWSAIGHHLGARRWPSLFFASGWLGSMRSVRDAVRWLVVHEIQSLLSPGERWSHGQVRTVVREVIATTTGVSDFSDDADFIRGLRLD